MKCKNCGCEVICSPVKEAQRRLRRAPITTGASGWSSMSEMLSLLTPNGESIYGTPAGKLENAVGVAYHPTLADCCPSSTVAGIAGAARSTMTERAASWWTWTRELAENRTSVRSRATPLTVNPATR